MNEKSLYHTFVSNHDGLKGVSYVENQSGNEGLSLGVSSSLINAPGANPEQFIGFALSTCFNATVRIVERRMKLPEDSKLKTRVDIVKDVKGYKFLVEAQILFEHIDLQTAQQVIDEAIDECPVAKLLKDNEGVTFKVVSEFDQEETFGE